jgi:hydrogenase maturation factor
MEQGSLNELVLTRSAIKHIRKHSKDIVAGAAVGNDFSRVSDIVTTEGVYNTPFIAWTKAMNNLSTSGAEPIGVRLEVMLPESAVEADVKAYMKEFNELADASGISILGGHTEVRNYYKKASFVVVVIGRICGESERNGDGSRIKPAAVRLGDVKKITPGADIIMTKHTALLGTDLIVDICRDELENYFARSYIDGAVFGADSYSVEKEARLLYDSGQVYYMHDVSHGGIYGALWQLAVKIKRGIAITHEALNIRQETVEICEYFNINPYMLDGTGALLAVVNDGDRVVEMLLENGIEACVIGRVSEDNAKSVLMGGEPIEKRFLNMVSGDEIYKLARFSAY